MSTNMTWEVLIWCCCEYYQSPLVGYRGDDGVLNGCCVWFVERRWTGSLWRSLVRIPSRNEQPALLNCIYQSSHSTTTSSRYTKRSASSGCRDSLALQSSTSPTDTWCSPRSSSRPYSRSSILTLQRCVYLLRSIYQTCHSTDA